MSVEKRILLRRGQSEPMYVARHHYGRNHKTDTPKKPVIVGFLAVPDPACLYRRPPA